MKGTLTEQPLTELIREISTKNLSGTLRLEHERVQTAVYFDNGDLIYAASNLRTLRLREYLNKTGVVSDKDRARFQNNLSDLALAAALTSSGTLQQKDVDALLTSLVSDVLRVALLWTEGTWDFNDRARLDDPVHAQVDIPALLREAAQRMPLSFVSERFRNPAEIISPASEVSLTSNFLPTEGFMLSRIDQPTRLEDLVALSGLPELDAYRLIYGLALSGLVHREDWHNAFRADQAKPKAKKKTGARVASATPASDAEQAGSRWGSAKDEEENLEKFLLRQSQATNYYEVIEIPTTAATNEIKEAYYSLARRYHPDRFHLQSGTALHAKLSSAFARITQAYETLTDPGARSTYDQKLERSRQRAAAAPNTGKAESKAGSDDVQIKTGGPDSAEHNFREGLGALKEGRNKAAVTYLAAAARLEPQEARYRAYYGSALATSEETRRLAENEILAAVKLAPANANFRTMLAELYFDLKFPKRAQTEVERALAIDPNNASARALLRKLENSRKVG